MRNSKQWTFVITQFFLTGLIIVSALYEYKIMHRETPLAVYILSAVLLFSGFIGLMVTAITFRQRITPFLKPRQDAKLVRTGIYSIIRHPMYFFLSVLLLGYCLYFAAYGSLILCAFMILFFDFKIRREEIYLKQRFPEYAGYQKQTKKFIPFIY